MRIAGLVVAALLLASCSFGKDIAAADKGVAAFHASLNVGNVEAIIGAAGPELNAPATRLQFGKLLDAVHRKLGAYVSGNRTGFNDRADSQGHFTTVTYDSTYQRGSARETFVFRLADGGSRLVGYNINSAEMAIN